MITRLYTQKACVSIYFDFPSFNFVLISWIYKKIGFYLLLKI